MVPKGGGERTFNLLGFKRGKGSGVTLLIGEKDQTEGVERLHTIT